MIKREDVLSLEYLKKTEYTGSHEGMRYRLEGAAKETGKRLLATVWPEPFNFVTTPGDKKQHEEFDFSEDGITDAVAWMNDRLFEMKEERFLQAAK
ncbi:MAG: hypothetical protein UFG06_06090 [Lachnospiraceae bacterium]|nr:hypothetical protein [Lachnospiraceae bacterium]